MAEIAAILKLHGLSGGIFIAFFFLLKWVLETSKQQTEQANRERESWVVAQDKFADRMQALDDSMRTNLLTNKAFFDSVTEAHRFQREEHKQMIESLGRINGHK